MPLYSYYCPSCQELSSGFSSVDRRNDPVPCSCGTTKVRQTVYRPMVRPDLPGYDCPVTGKWIEGRRAHEENLRRHGCHTLEPGEREAVDRRRAASNAKLEADIEATVEQTIHEMPIQKREQLAVELQSGVSADIVRQ